MVRSVLFHALWACWTLLIGLVGMPLLCSQRAIWWLCRQWAQGSLWLLKHVAGIHSEWRGHANPSPRMIYACKHQSTWETLVLWCVLPNPIFVLKRGLYLIPIFGWYLWRSGQIAIDRKGGKRTVEQINSRAAQAIAEGRPIVIFPEGTRVAVGAPTHYHRGIAYLSQHLGVPVVPMAINAGAFWSPRRRGMRAGTAIIELLPPMPACSDDIAGWLGTLETQIETASAALLPPEA